MSRAARLAVLLAAFLGLAGCDTMPKTVKVPYPVYCSVGTLPVRPARAALPPEPDVYAEAAVLAAERIRVWAYVGQLEGVIAGCEPPAGAETFDPRVGVDD